jgi:O-antigen ligase
MIANNIQTRDQIKRFCGAMILTALIVALVAISQIPSGERISAPFEGERGEPNTLGGYLLFVSCIIAGIALEMDRDKISSYLWALVGLFTVPFLFTLSRGSYLAAPFCYIAMGFLHKAKRMRMLFFLVIIGALGIVAMPSTVRERVFYTFNQKFTQQERLEVGGVRLDTSTTERLRSWENVFRDITKSPIWGFGVTGYGFLDAQYPRVLIETGLLGIVLFGALIYSVFKLGFRVRRESKDLMYRGLANGLIAGLVGLLFHGLSTNTFVIVRIMEPFWLVVGLVVCSEQIEKKEQGAQHEETSQDPKAA